MSLSPLGGVHGSVDRRTARCGPGLGLGEVRVVRPGVRGTELEPAHGLDPAGQEHVALARLDGVGRHADGLQRRRAVAVDRHPGHVHPGQDGGHAGHVVARLAGGLAAPEQDVLDEGGVELGHLGQDLFDDQGGQVVGAAAHERPLVGAPDGRSSGGDDDGVGHGAGSLGTYSGNP